MKDFIFSEKLNFNKVVIICLTGIIAYAVFTYNDRENEKICRLQNKDSVGTNEFLVASSHHRGNCYALIKYEASHTILNMSSGTKVATQKIYKESEEFKKAKIKIFGK